MPSKARTISATASCRRWRSATDNLDCHVAAASASAQKQFASWVSTLSSIVVDAMPEVPHDPVSGQS